MAMKLSRRKFIAGICIAALAINGALSGPTPALAGRYGKLKGKVNINLNCSDWKYKNFFWNGGGFGSWFCDKPTQLPTLDNNGFMLSAVFTGTISGTTLTVLTVVSGYITSNGFWNLIGDGLSGGTSITAQLTGTPGGVGTYTVNNSQTIASAIEITTILSTNPAGISFFVPANNSKTFLGPYEIGWDGTRSFEFNGWAIGSVTVNSAVGAVTSMKYASQSSFSGGSLYTPGTYNNIAMTGGAGSGLRCDIKVGASGRVIFCQPTGGKSGTGFVSGFTNITPLNGNADIGGTGSGFGTIITIVDYCFDAGSGFTCAGTNGKVVITFNANSTQLNAASNGNSHCAYNNRNNIPFLGSGSAYFCLQRDAASYQAAFAAQDWSKVLLPEWLDQMRALNPGIVRAMPATDPNDDHNTQSMPWTYRSPMTHLQLETARFVPSIFCGTASYAAQSGSTPETYTLAAYPDMPGSWTQGEVFTFVMPAGSTNTTTWPQIVVGGRTAKNMSSGHVPGTPAPSTFNALDSNGNAHVYSGVYDSRLDMVVISGGFIWSLTPIEALVGIANALDCDLWVNPHHFSSIADARLLVKYAKLNLRRRLATAVSNEMWEVGTNAYNQWYYVRALGWNVIYLTGLVGGTLYTDGTYNNVTMQYVTSGGATTALKCNIVVAGGTVTQVSPVADGGGVQGKGYSVGELITCPAASIGGTGSGFQIAIANIGYQSSGMSSGGYYSGVGLLDRQFLGAFTLEWQSAPARIMSDLARVIEWQAVDPPITTDPNNSTDKYLLRGTELAAFSDAASGLNFSQVGSRPIDFCDWISYASYWNGAQAAQWVSDGCCTQSDAMSTWGPFPWGKWNSSNNYVTNDIVWVSGGTQGYQALSNNTNTPPAANPGVWNPVTVNGSLLNAADQFALGDPQNVAAAMAFMEADARGQTYNGVLGHYGKGGLYPLSYWNNLSGGGQSKKWNDAAVTYSKRVACYEGCPCSNPPSVLLLTNCGFSAEFANKYGGPLGRIALLLYAFKKTDAYRQICKDQFDQFFQFSQSEYTVQYLVNGQNSNGPALNSPFSVFGANNYGVSPFKSFDAIVEYDHGI